MIGALVRFLLVSGLAGLAIFELATAAMAAVWLPHAGGFDLQAMWLSRGVGYLVAAWGLLSRQPAAYPFTAALMGFILAIRETPIAKLNDFDPYRPGFAQVALGLTAALAVLDAFSAWRQRRAAAAPG